LLFYLGELQIVCARKSWIAFGAGKHFHYIAAHELAAALGGDKEKSTPCFPGCDTSSFAGQFGKSAWETWSNFPQVINAIWPSSSTAELYSRIAPVSAAAAVCNVCCK